MKKWYIVFGFAVVATLIIFFIATYIGNNKTDNHENATLVYQGIGEKK